MPSEFTDETSMVTGSVTDPSPPKFISAERAGDGRLLLAVADTGRGIPPDMIDQVLDPFHSADAFKANKGRGVGLGLPICRWLMELHGGSLTIASRTPEGTTVTAGFPKERVLDPV